jgi:hypothetical protein
MKPLITFEEKCRECDGRGWFAYEDKTAMHSPLRFECRICKGTGNHIIEVYDTRILFIKKLFKDYKILRIKKFNELLINEKNFYVYFQWVIILKEHNLQQSDEVVVRIK